MTDDQVVEAVSQRLDGKKHYRVYATETVYYRMYVWAESPDAARDLIYEGEVDIPEPFDAGDFNIATIEVADE